MSEIDVRTMLSAARTLSKDMGLDAAYAAALAAWEALPPAERERRAVQVRAAIAGTPVPWGAIAERVARHAWEVSAAVDRRRRGPMMPDWPGLVREWCDGYALTIDDAMGAARLAARALAEALGYRLDGAPAEVPQTAARDDNADRRAEARRFITLATRPNPDDADRGAMLDAFCAAVGIDAPSSDGAAPVCATGAAVP